MSSSPLFFLLFLLFSLSLLLPPSHAAASCANYTQSFCADVINYPVYVTFPQTTTELIMLSEEAGGIGNLTEIGGKIHPLCADAARKYACAKAFPRCADPEAEDLEPEYVCRSVCERFVSLCSEMIIAFGREDVIPTCESHPNCVDFEFSDSLPQNFECPEPLILRPAGLESTNCMGECCVPCPQGHYFYPEGLMERHDVAVSVLSFMSFLGATFVTLVYLLAPEKRSYPQYIILCMGICMFFWYIPVIIGLRDRNIVRCINEVEPSAPGNNVNPICYFQSIVTIYFILAAAAWYLVLVINVYMNVIFLSQRMRDFHKYWHLVCWTLPLIPTIVAMGINKTGYIFGNWCIVDFGIYLELLLMLPLALVIFPSVIMNIHVLVRIAVIAKQRHASLKSILALQLRFFIFVMVVLFIFLTFWLQYEVKMKNVTYDVNAQWIKDWFFCVASGGGRNGCSPIALPNLPEYNGFSLSEISISIIGIVLFVFFGMRMEVLVFCLEIFKCNFNRIRDVSFSTVEFGNNSNSGKGGSVHEKATSTTGRTPSSRNELEM